MMSMGIFCALDKIENLGVDGSQSHIIDQSDAMAQPKMTRLLKRCPQRTFQKLNDTTAAFAKGSKQPIAKSTETMLRRLLRENEPILG